MNSTMIRAVMICPEEDLSMPFRRALAGFRQVDIGRALDEYPNEAKLPVFLKASVPDMIFISAGNPDAAAAVVARINVEAPGTFTVAFGRSSEGAAMLKLLRAGARDFLVAPFELEVIGSMLRRVEAVRKTQE